MRHLLRFLALSVCAGIVAAGLAIPVAGSSAAALGAGMDLFDSLPAELDDRPLAQPSTALTKDGTTIATFSWQNRDEVPLERISRPMRDATLAIEDRRFYEHGPVDVEGVARAVAKNLLTGSLHGGSTLTQQYVKNVLINASQADGDEQGIDRARDRSGVSGMARKPREMRLAITVEKTFTKDEIMGRYLNIASYSGSPNVYGVQAAARQYWGVDAAELSIAQAATLAGIVRNPYEYNPQKNPEAVIERRNLVLEKMAEYGYITADEQKEAAESGLDLKPNVTPNGPRLRR
ncbi:transglycosylase domain-containing protein [Brevibacterium casei]|nr:transglycosylase domain-containing protein [Brevibacterium casei]